MQIPCSRAQACLPTLESGWPATPRALWSGTNTGGPSSSGWRNSRPRKSPPASPETGIILEIPLSLREELIRSLEEFAAQQQLPLAPPSGPELVEDVVLAACHLPVQNLFVFAEEPRLVVKRRGEAVELALTGAFKARRVPCQETDLVIHLTRAAMARLVALVLSLARGGL